MRYNLQLVERQIFTTSKCERLEPGFLPILLVHECVFILPELLTESMSFSKSSHSDLAGTQQKKAFGETSELTGQYSIVRDTLEGFLVNPNLEKNNEIVVTGRQGC